VVVVAQGRWSRARASSFLWAWLSTAPAALKEAEGESESESEQAVPVTHGKARGNLPWDPLRPETRCGARVVQ